MKCSLVYWQYISCWLGKLPINIWNFEWTIYFTFSGSSYPVSVSTWVRFGDGLEIETDVLTFENRIMMKEVKIIVLKIFLLLPWSVTVNWKSKVWVQTMLPKSILVSFRQYIPDPSPQAGDQVTHQVFCYKSNVKSRGKIKYIQVQVCIGTTC